MPKEVQIFVDGTTETPEEMADCLELIAKLIREGNTSGFYPSWSLIIKE